MNTNRQQKTKHTAHRLQLNTQKPLAARQRGGLHSLNFLMGILWLCAVVGGLLKLMQYEVTPAPATSSPALPPAASRIVPTPGVATLIMFAHPKCPCTRASLSELARILANSSAPVSTTILFYQPENVAAGWEKTALYTAAAAMPGVHILSDEGGKEARRYHVIASGHTLLYAASGHLLFSGGITGARGHEGDNDGAEAIIALLAHKKTGLIKTPVFGCTIQDQDFQPGKT